MFEQSAMNVFFIATCPAIGSGAGRRPSDRVHAPFSFSVPVSVHVSVHVRVPVPVRAQVVLGVGGCGYCQCALISVWYI